MGAPASVSPLEAVLARRVLELVAAQESSPRPAPVVVEVYRDVDVELSGDVDGELCGDTDVELSGEVLPDSGAGELPARDPLGLMRDLAAQRAGVEAQMVAVAQDVVARTGEVLLAEKGFTSVEELSVTARRRWRAEAKSTAVAELQVALGMRVMAARRLVGLACAPTSTRSVVLGAMERGEASLDMALRFWERCSRLEEQDGADVASAMFGTDSAAAVPERLDPAGQLLQRPWHAGEYDEALEREALRRESRDVEARREQRRRARARRDTTMRVQDDGTATLSVGCALTTGAGVYQRIDRASRALRAAGDPRTLAQLRSDITCALLLHGTLPLPGTDGSGGRSAADRDALVGTDHDDGLFDLDSDDLVSPADLAEIGRVLAAAPPVRLHVVIPWDSLTGRPAGAGPCLAPCCVAAAGTCPPADADRPGRPPDPPGRPPGGPSATDGVGRILGLAGAFITPEHARVLAMQAGTTFVRLLTDPADGRLIERSIATYRPDAEMRRQVRAADLRSRAPGSTRPAVWCDIDHEHPWSEGGPTSETNLNCKDRRTHSFKTKGWWRTTMTPNRDVTWTTLLGQTETTRAHDYRQYLGAAVPADPDQKHVHPSQRSDREDRLDLAGQALYAALVHRDPHALLADPDDAHGATEHDPSLGGWVRVSHTNPDGVRRHGPPPDHPTVTEILGLPDHDVRRAAGGTGPHGSSETGSTGTPWSTRATDDDTPPF